MPNRCYRLPFINRILNLKTKYYVRIRTRDFKRTNECSNSSIGNEMLKSKLLVVSTLGAKFGKDGNQYYYIIGDLPEKDCIVGFGETPLKALDEFCKMYGL